MSDTTIYVHPAARYGRSATGPEDARDEFWNRQTANDTQQGAIQGGMGYANGQAATGKPMQVTQDQGLANNAASGAGGNQREAINLAQGLATGAGPSQAALQLQRGLTQGLAQQTAMGRSARGSAALATAGTDAQANQAAMQQQAFTAGGMLRSQDMAAGRGMLNSALGQQRDQANQQLAEGDSVNQANAQNQDQYRLGMGQAGVAFGNVGNAQEGQDQGVYGAGMAPISAQDEANQQYQRWIADANKQAVSANGSNG
jgi:hypothetical protein